MAGQPQLVGRVSGPRGVVANDRCFDPLEGHLHLKSPRSDAGGCVLGDPGDDLLGRTGLRCVVTTTSANRTPFAASTSRPFAAPVWTS